MKLKRTPVLLALSLLVGCSDAGQEANFVEQEIQTSVVYTLTNVHAGRCIDVSSSSVENGANIQLWDCHGGANQQFTFESAESGYYLVRNVHSGRCLDVWGWSTENGANIAQWDCHGGHNQQFAVEDVAGGGVVRLVSRLSGQALDGWGWGTTNGTNVAQWPVTGGANQQFIAQIVGSAGDGDSGDGDGSPPDPSDPYACDGSTDGYDLVVSQSGGSWVVRRNGSQQYSSSDMRTAMQEAINRLTAGRNWKESILVQGSGSMPASTRLSLASYTVLNVCGTINVTGSGSGDMAPIYARGRTDIEIPNVSITGSPNYGMFFRDVDRLIIGNADLRVTSGLGIRIDNHGRSNRADKVDDIEIGDVYVEGTGAHGVEFYGANNVVIGSVTARDTGYSGLLLNDSTNVTVGLVDADGAGTGTGYAAFRMANRNGRVGSNYPTNIFVGEVRARGGGRGIFCVSESGGAQIERINLQNTGNNSILIENCYNISLATQSGSISGGGELRLAARSDFPNNRDITIQNLSVSNTSIRESPCAENSTFANISLQNTSMNVCN